MATIDEWLQHSWSEDDKTQLGRLKIELEQALRWEANMVKQQTHERYLTDVDRNTSHHCSRPWHIVYMKICLRVFPRGCPVRIMIGWLKSLSSKKSRTCSLYRQIVPRERMVLSDIFLLATGILFKLIYWLWSMVSFWEITYRDKLCLI